MIGSGEGPTRIDISQPLAKSEFTWVSCDPRIKNFCFFVSGDKENPKSSLFQADLHLDKKHIPLQRIWRIDSAKDVPMFLMPPSGRLIHYRRRCGLPNKTRSDPDPGRALGQHPMTCAFHCPAGFTMDSSTRRLPSWPSASELAFTTTAMSSSSFWQSSCAKLATARWLRNSKPGRSSANNGPGGSITRVSIRSNKQASNLNRRTHFLPLRPCR